MKILYYRSKDPLEEKIDGLIENQKKLSRTRKRLWKENSAYESTQIDSQIDFIPKKLPKISDQTFRTKIYRKGLRKEFSMNSRKDIIYLSGLILLILVLVGFISFVIYISVILLGVRHQETSLENIYRQRINETNQNSTFAYLTDLRDKIEVENSPLLYTVEEYSKREGKEEDFYNRQEVDRKKRGVKNLTEKLIEEKSQTEKDVENFYEFFDKKEELRKQTEYKHYLNYMNEYIPESDKRDFKLKLKQPTLTEKILVEGGQKQIEDKNSYS